MKSIYGMSVREGLDEILEPAICALVVVDMQVDAVANDGKIAANGNDVSAIQAIVPKCAELLESARRSGVFVIHARVITLADGRSDSPSWYHMKSADLKTPDLFLEGTAGAEFIDELKPMDGETIVTKRRSSAFVGTDLEMILRSNGIETVVVIGEQTPGCVEATFRDAAYHDFYNVLVEDCVAAFTQSHHDASLLIQRARHDVCMAEDVMKIWEPSSWPEV
jgi:biuret amidohydrolase